MAKQHPLNIDLSKESSETLTLKLTQTGAKFNSNDVKRLLDGTHKTIQYAFIDPQNNIIAYITTR